MIELSRGMAWRGPMAVALLPHEEVALKALLAAGGELSWMDLERQWGVGNARPLMQGVSRTIEVLGVACDSSRFGVTLRRAA